jgi:hypothetical protein
MQYGLARLIDPTGEPLTLEQAKNHLRVDFDDDDDLIASLLTSAREYVEEATHRICLPQTWQLTSDHFPGFGMDGHPRHRGDGYPDLWDGIAFKLPLGPVTSVPAIGYIDGNGVPQTLSPSQYVTDLTTLPPRVTPLYGQIWPVPRYQVGAVNVTFIAGYGQANVPKKMLAAIRLLLSHWYEHREAAAAGDYKEVPLGVQALLGITWDGAVGGHVP